MSLPSDQGVCRLLNYLMTQYEERGVPIVDVAELKRSCSLADAEFQQIVNHFHPVRAFQLLGSDRLQFDPIVLNYKARFPLCSLNDAFCFFRQSMTLASIKARAQALLDTVSDEFPQGRVTQEAKDALLADIDVLVADIDDSVPYPTIALTPTIVLKAILEFGGRVDDGRLIESVALPWFDIMKMIKVDPDAIYSIDPYIWEEIIAGAYTRAGFDEVVLTPRSGDKGRDVVATKHGIGSIRIFDQVKAYKPGHLVTAEEVRAMVGVITAAGNVSKGVVTTTSNFAPRILQVDYVRALVPYRLELKGRDELLSWLDQPSRGSPDRATD
jgi:restriction system protein